MLKQTALCVLLGVAGALPACGSASDNNFSGPAAAGSAMKGGASGSSGSATTGGHSGSTGKGGTSSMGGSGGSGGGTGGTGGSDVGGTGMGGSATQGGSSGDAAMGGTGMATGGTDPGVGGTDPGMGGTDPGVGGTDPGMGGTGMTTGGAGGMGGRGGKGGTGGSAGTPNCDELAMQYAEALAAARACNAKSGKDQCTDTMPGSLTCGCDVYVNPDNQEAITELKRLRKEGASCSMVCPAIACINPGPAQCGADPTSDGLCRSLGAILQ